MLTSSVHKQIEPHSLKFVESLERPSDGTLPLLNLVVEMTGKAGAKAGVPRGCSYEVLGN